MTNQPVKNETVELDEEALRAEHPDIMGAIQFACPDQARTTLSLLETKVKAYLDKNALSRFTAVKTAMVLIQVMLFVIRTMTKNIIELDRQNFTLRGANNQLRDQLLDAQEALEAARARERLIAAILPIEALIETLTATAPTITDEQPEEVATKVDEQNEVLPEDDPDIIYQGPPNPPVTEE